MNGSNFLIDTNVFIETLIRRDEECYRDCLMLLQAVKHNQVNAIMAGVELAELVWVLGRTYKLKKAEIINAVKSVIQLRGLKLTDDYDYREALSLYGKYRVKYIDCLLASIPEVREKSWMVVSYDKDFDKLGVVRKEPAEVLKEVKIEK